MQYGMPTLIENKTLNENIVLCKELGLNFIELNMNFPEYQIDRLEQTSDFYQAADEAGIYYTIHLDENLNIADFNPFVREAYLETVRKTIQVAKKFVELKNKYGEENQPLIINMHMHHGIYITLPDRKVQMYERDFAIYMEYFKIFRNSCEKWIGESDIKIAIENTEGFRDYEKKVIDYLLDSPCFVLTWDIGHSKATGEKDVPFIQGRKQKLKHFHIHDGSENPPKNHLALGDGEIDLADRIRLAKECNARCVLETKTIEALRKSVKWIHKKKVAFICVHNSCRSQIAEALGKHLAGDVFESYSAGTETKPQINQDAVRLMKEIYGIDMEAAGQHSKLISEIPEVDIAISMGCNVGCPFIGRAFDDNWGLEDPTGKSDEEFKLVIKEIEKRVVELKERLFIR